MTASVAVAQPAAARPVASRTFSASALPTDRLNFGLASPPGDFSWMQTSGVPWKYRYTYLSAGVNTSSGWETWNTPSGAYATFYMNATDSLGAIPVFSYYEMLQSLFWIGKVYPTGVEFAEYDWRMESFRFSNFVCVSRQRPDLKEMVRDVAAGMGQRVAL